MSVTVHKETEMPLVANLAGRTKRRSCTQNYSFWKSAEICQESGTELRKGKIFVDITQGNYKLAMAEEGEQYALSRSDWILP